MAFFYLLVVLEVLYMSTPFAIYFYSVYNPGLTFFNSNPYFAWLSSFFLPHIVVETSSTFINLHNWIGGIIAVVSFGCFCVGAAQVYYHKLAHKGPVTGGVYNVIRHPQYTAWAICGFGMLLVWPRYTVLMMYVAMLFAYYFLARSEERECEQKYGQAYAAYKERTAMFLPIRIPFAKRLPSLPRSSVLRFLAILTLYIVTVSAAIGVANGLKNWSLDSLYGYYTPHSAYVSISKIDPVTLENIAAIAMQDVAVQNRLAAAIPSRNAKFINYVLPTTWNVPEIPMNPVGAGHHENPQVYDRSQYRVVITRAEVRSEIQPAGRSILVNTLRRIPLLEIVVDLNRQAVVSIQNPTQDYRYDNVPVPVF